MASVWTRRMRVYREGGRITVYGVRQLSPTGDYDVKELSEKNSFG
jgi:hypothetical protein